MLQEMLVNYLSPYFTKTNIMTGNRSLHPITHFENAQISFPLCNIIQFLILKDNIILIFKLIDHTNFVVEFTPSVYVKDLQSKTMFIKRERQSNIYICKESSHSMQSCFPMSASSSTEGSFIFSQMSAVLNLLCQIYDMIGQVIIVVDFWKDLCQYHSKIQYIFLF